MYILNIGSYWEGGKRVCKREKREKKTCSDFIMSLRVVSILLNHWNNFPLLKFLLCVKYCVTYRKRCIFYNLTTPVHLYYRWGYQSPKRLSNLSRDRKLAGGKVGIRSQAQFTSKPSFISYSAESFLCILLSSKPRVWRGEIWWHVAVVCMHIFYDIWRWIFYWKITFML